jgi:hypothetical protein
MFELTPEDAFRLFTEWLTENEPVLAERGMKVAVSPALFSDPQAWLDEKGRFPS